MNKIQLFEKESPFVSPQIETYHNLLWYNPFRNNLLLMANPAKSCLHNSVLSRSTTCYYLWELRLLHLQNMISYVGGNHIKG